MVFYRCISFHLCYQSSFTKRRSSMQNDRVRLTKNIKKLNLYYFSKYTMAFYLSKIYLINLKRISASVSWITPTEPKQRKYIDVPICPFRIIIRRLSNRSNLITRHSPSLLYFQIFFWISEFLVANPSIF